MKRSFFIPFLAAVTLLVTGCARHQGYEYEARSYSQVKEVRIGTVIEHRYVFVRDDGQGTFFGALFGAILGSKMGAGEGRGLATIAGGIAGGVVGSELGKANAEELTVELDNGEVIVVVVKGGNAFLVGDRVRIVLDGYDVATVTRIPFR
jgi:outer membrane lipoprotein SlyB